MKLKNNIPCGKENWKIKYANTFVHLAFEGNQIVGEKCSEQALAIYTV